MLWRQNATAARNPYTKMRVTLDYWDYALVTFVGLYAISAPYSKVEESFNLQAIHDLLYYGADVEKV
jgi:hypothetical protein